jgi:hypothetical protein
MYERMSSIMGEAGFKDCWFDVRPTDAAPTEMFKSRGGAGDPWQWVRDESVYTMYGFTNDQSRTFEKPPQRLDHVWRRSPLQAHSLLSCTSLWVQDPSVWRADTELRLKIRTMREEGGSAGEMRRLLTELDRRNHEDRLSDHGMVLVQIRVE